MPAGIFEPNVRQHRRFHLNVELFADFFAHAVQVVLAARANFLIFGQIVFNALPRQIGWQRLSAAFLVRWAICLWQTGVGRAWVILLVLCLTIVALCQCLRGHLFGFVKSPVFVFLAAGRKTLALCETELFFQNQNALIELGDLL
jgi:hypothetical protein